MEIEQALEMFGVSDINTLNSEELKKQYKALMKKYHPDVYAGDPSISQHISEAYQILKDTAKKIEAYRAIKVKTKVETLFVPLSILIKIRNGRTFKKGEKILDKGSIVRYNVVALIRIKIMINGIEEVYNNLEDWDFYQRDFKTVCNVAVKEDDILNPVPISIETCGVKRELTLSYVSTQYNMKIDGYGLSIVFNKVINKEE